MPYLLDDNTQTNEFEQMQIIYQWLQTPNDDIYQEYTKQQL